MTGKVVAFVIRASHHGCHEILAFQHPMAGVQFPAGSLYDGEDPTSGCLRELYEETGLGGEDVRLLGEIGRWVEESNGLTRHTFQIQCRRETPDEWWVVTPDGDGLCWRCHWIPVNGAEPLHPMQRPWLDRLRPRVMPAEHAAWAWEPVPVELVDETTVDVFFGPGVGDQWYTASWLPGRTGNEDVARQAIGFAVTRQGGAVIVRHREGRELIPGGTREPGETLRETLERELHEEACARVVDAELFGHMRAARRGPDGVSDIHYGSRWWARVELDPWAPEWEMAERRLLPYANVLGELHAWRFPVNERWISTAISIEHSRRG
ncbi:MAG: NUDIX domain-containing protein [Acidimicrobiales bacterium]